MLSPCRVGAACFACEDSARCSRTRSLVGLSHARVSRGVSAIEAALAFELGPAHPSSLAASPENEIRDAFDPFLLPYNSVNEHPYPIRFRPIVTGSSPGVYSMGCRPPRPEIVRFTDAPIASADRARVRHGGLLSPVRIFPDPRFSSSGFPGPRRRAIVRLTPLSRPSRMPVRAFFAVRASRLHQDRQGCFHLARVTARSFPQPRTPSIDKERAALLPPFRAAIAHPLLYAGSTPRSPARALADPRGPAPAVPSHPETR